MSASDMATPTAPSSNPRSADHKSLMSSTSPENITSLASLLAELQLEQVHKSLWRGNSHEAVQFQLSALHFVVDSKQQPLKLLWGDILGAHVLTSDGEHVQPLELNTLKQEDKFLLGIFACVCKNHKANTLKKRRLSEFFFRFDGHQVQQVLKLQKFINFVADPRNQEVVQKAESLDEIAVMERKKPRKFLVLLNPVSGPGRALQIYENKVAPMFKFANVDAELKVMEHANHAMEVVMEMPLGVYDCVVTVGGDGSLYEIVQGLMKRADWNVAIRQPIGIIPGGSGNGLAHSIAHQSEEKGKPVNAAFILAKGMPHDLDITSVRNGKETTYSFLSLEWASIADVDIGSEKLRMLGGLRFTVAFVNQLVFQRPEYPGKIWYLEDGENEEPSHYFETNDPKSTDLPTMDLFDGEGQGPPKISEPEDSKDTVENSEKAVGKSGKWKELGGHFRIVWVMNVSHAASDAHIAPGAQFDDGYNYITFMDGAHARKDLLAMMLAIETGDHMDKKGVQQVRTRAFKLVPERSTDLMCVDGEVVEGPYLEAQVHRGMARIMAVPRWQSKNDNKSGTIDRSEFYSSIDEKHSEFGDSIFALIDEDSSGVLDFSEYVEALGKFCLLNKEDMLKFCFNVFDDDKNGTIEGEELTHLLEILHEDEQTSNMKQALKTFDFNGDGKIDFAEFKQLNTQFPSLLYPAFRIQQNMKIFTLGEKWWERKIDELAAEHQEKLMNQAGIGNVADMTDEALAEKKAELERTNKLKRQEQAIRIHMGCLYYTCCPCRRNLYIIDDEQSSDSDSDSDEDRARRKKKAAAPTKGKKGGKKQNIVPVGPRKPLSQEERLERARKRRLRDMQDRPTRKD